MRKGFLGVLSFALAVLTSLAQPVSGPLVSTNRGVPVFTQTNGKKIDPSPVYIDATGNLYFGGPGTVIVNDMTTAERNLLSATNGMVIYNTTDAKLQVRENGSWVDIGSGTGVFMSNFDQDWFRTNGAIVRPALTKTLPSWINVTDVAYGATPGNAADDDALSFQAAVNAVGAAGGGVVYVPRGTYDWATAINLTNNMTLLFDSGARIVRKASTPAISSGMIGINGGFYTNLTITGPGVIDGNKANNTNGYGINLAGVNIRVEGGLIITNHVWNGLTFGYHPTPSTISSNCFAVGIVLANCGKSGESWGNFSIVRGRSMGILRSHSSNPDGFAAYAFDLELNAVDDNTWSGDIQFIGNTILHGRLYATGNSSSNGYVNGVFVKDNVVDARGAWRSGFASDAATFFRQLRNLQVSGNTIYGFDTTNTSLGQRNAYMANVLDAEFSNNKWLIPDIPAFNEYAIVFDGTAGFVCTNLTFHNETFSSYSNTPAAYAFVGASTGVNGFRLSNPILENVTSLSDDARPYYTSQEQNVGRALRVGNGIALMDDAQINTNLAAGSAVITNNAAASTVTAGGVTATNSYTLGTGTTFTKSGADLVVGNPAGNMIFDHGFNYLFQVGSVTKLQMDSSGAYLIGVSLLLDNAKSIWWKDSGATYRQVITLTGGNDLQIESPTTGGGIQLIGRAAAAAVDIYPTASTFGARFINTNLSVVGQSSAEVLLGQRYQFPPPSYIVLSGDAFTAVKSHHWVDTEGGAGTDDLATINGALNVDGTILILTPAADSRTIVLKHGTGNILCQGNADLPLDDVQDFAILKYDSNQSKWFAMIGTGSGEANTASNLGAQDATHQGLFKSKSALDLQFRSIEAGANITLTSNANTLTITSTGGGGGGGSGSLQNATVTGSGTDYTITDTYARVDFGAGDPTHTLPAAGTYLLVAHLSQESANTFVKRFKFRDTTASADVAGSEIYEDYSGGGHPSEVAIHAVYTSPGANTVQLWAQMNDPSYTGTHVVWSTNTTFSYVRLDGVLGFNVNAASVSTPNFQNTAATGTVPAATVGVTGTNFSVTIGPASATEAGVVTTGTQSFDGPKTFLDNILVTNGVFAQSVTVSNLSGSLPVQSDGSDMLVSAAIDLASADVTGVLALGNLASGYSFANLGTGTNAALMAGNFKDTATRKSQAGTLSGATPTVDWQTEPLKFHIVSAPITYGEANRPTSATAGESLEIHMTNSTGSDQPIVLPAGWRDETGVGFTNLVAGKTATIYTKWNSAEVKFYWRTYEPP